MAASSAPALHLDLPVEGMSCASCVGRVEKAIRAVPGVGGVAVNLATGKAGVDLAAPGALPGVLAAIRKAGYEPAETELDLAVEGMSCAACVGRVEKALKATPGVLDASVNLATGKAHLRYAGGPSTSDAALARLERIGYPARSAESAVASADDQPDPRAREAARHARAAVFAGLLTVPLLVLEMGPHLVETFHHTLMGIASETTIRIVSFVLASLVQFGPGLPFYRKGVPALLRGAPDMNSLVVIGTSTAWLYSTVSTFAPGLLPDGLDHTYFESAAVIVTLILAGRAFEARAKGRTGEAIRRLMTLQARSARIVDDAGERDVPVAEVRPGMVVVMRPGERVPVDGEVIDGSSFVDEAMITGEPIPAAKGAGATVVGGTVNKTGTFRFRATKVGADTLLARIVKTVEAAQSSKLPIQGLVDRVTLWFVPAVLAIALLTFAGWLLAGGTDALGLAVVSAVSVLIIACPCAMGLATPTSILVGTGRAAELGILFRRGEALQALKGTTIGALDKTGTLTLGRPELTDLVPADGFDADDVLRLVAAVESRSEHPVAAAIVAEARRRGLAGGAVEAFDGQPGFGVTALVDGRRVAVGAERMMVRDAVAPGPLAEVAARLAQHGRTPLYAAIDGRIAAVLAVADPVKETTPQALQALREAGVRLVMITGDAQATAQAIARGLGIDEVIAEVLPTDKAGHVARLQAAGKVAFVGDGINDAPALAQADVGIAIGTGTDVAIESADVVLMSGDLRNVANALALSRATLRNIGQNLAWAFGYNIVLIPVAAGVLFPAFGILMSPIFASFAMALSSVSVVSNALRLRGFRAPLREEAPALPAVQPT